MPDQPGTSTAGLRRAGHPFAKRHGSPQAALLPINRQSGVFEASWQKSTVSVSGGEVRGEVVNTAPYAGFLATGTKVAFARPLPEAVIAATEAKGGRVIEEEIGRVL